MNTLLNRPPISTAEISSSEALVAALHRRVRSNVDRSKSALIFQKFLEDQLSIELLPKGSSLNGDAARDATTEPGDTVATPSVTILSRIAKTLGTTMSALTRALRQFCKAPGCPAPSSWKPTLWRPGLTGRRPSRPEFVSTCRRSFSVDDAVSDPYVQPS